VPTTIPAAPRPAAKVRRETRGRRDFVDIL
jgi:hypothetical protein